MRCGPNTCQAQILRRPAQTNVGGVALGAFEPVWKTWASWRYATGRENAAAGLAENPIDLVVRVNDSSRNREITSADRVGMIGGEFAIVNVAPRDRQGGFIELQLRREIGG